jgi:hypothetical protein
MKALIVKVCQGEYDGYTETNIQVFLVPNRYTVEKLQQEYLDTDWKALSPKEKRAINRRLQGWGRAFCEWLGYKKMFKVIPFQEIEI